ncbi:Permease of the drug/metabolite transporter (DMT) superfamily [Anaerovirgula multivorans]|uniref:Permease of the drug/metabolite transporter (DMT) superfamily n=1 Tax=Anaerovirgula multivorans TaxID=312168 RepID=A0A239ALA1_9FIRM|nr:DMT family transporter [Anaerovirgula multivorans]SNR96455.1 Permease of the drug/metabolite transporter (DMT) superfamily [Anaerovirgula multivorans]
MNRLHDKKKYIADLSLLFVAAVWGGGFVAVKDALNTLTPMFLMTMRFVLASIILYSFLHRKIGKVNKDDFKKGSIVGTILFLAFAAQTYGLQFTTASKQGFLTATYVVIVPLLYWLLYRKPPKLKTFIGSFLTIVGIAFISLESSLTLNIGDLLTLVCAVFFAAHIISIEYFAKDMNVYKLAFVQIFVAAIWCIVLAFMTEPIPASLSARAWLAIVYLATFSTFACFTIQTIAQKYTSSSHASIILSLESVFAAVLGILILEETMTSMILLGCALIFIAILIVEVDLDVIKNLKKHAPDKYNI